MVIPGLQFSTLGWTKYAVRQLMKYQIGWCDCEGLHRTILGSSYGCLSAMLHIIMTMCWLCTWLCMAVISLLNLSFPVVSTIL